jgi:hypothetical protein
VNVRFVAYQEGQIFFADMELPTEQVDMLVQAGGLLDGWRIANEQEMLLSMMKRGHIGRMVEVDGKKIDIWSV